jgi:predicted nucleotide-binding protein
LPKTSNIEKLIGRLRELETEALRLEKADLSTNDDIKRQTYREKLDQLDKSHSHSWFGDHATTYYENFQAPPRTFDVEWGFIPGFSGSHNPGWRVFSRDEIRAFVFSDIGEEIFFSMDRLAKDVTEQFSNIRDQAIDVLEALSGAILSKAILRYHDAIDSKIKPYTIVDYINGCAKSTPNMTRGSEEIAKGKNVPTHIQYYAPFQSLDVNRRRLREFAGTLRKAIEAVNLTNEIKTRPMTMPESVFIGHGRSEQWRVLKDFLKERLGLSFEEFNRVSPAGISTQERLSEMLDRCGFAFLVFTAEDVHADITLHARENVIHEAGLFQGRLGWRRAIVLLEDGCEEFSNIVGLGQIRFAKGDIASCFEEVRRVLEREELLKQA